MINRQDVLKLCLELGFDLTPGIGKGSNPYAVCFFPVSTMGKVLCHIENDGHLISRPNLINFVEKWEPTMNDLLKFIIRSLEILDFSGYAIHVAVKKELVKVYMRKLRRSR